MVGTVVNVATVLTGSLIGFFLRERFSEALKHFLLKIVGLVTLLIGVKMGLKSTQILYPLIALLLGGMIGYALKIEQRLNNLAQRIGQRLSPEQSQFSQGFVMASLIFCVGPMTVLGSINEGLYGDPQLLLIKSVLDGFTAIRSW